MVVDVGGDRPMESGGLSMFSASASASASRLQMVVDVGGERPMVSGG
jgi:hypothetical protein